MKLSSDTHIAFVAPTVYRYYQGQGFGGAELQVVQLAKMFVQTGYRVTILTNDYGQKDEEVYDGVTVLKAPLRFLGGSNWYFLPDMLRFIRTLTKLSPDLCFFKNPNVILFPIALAAKINQKIKPVKIFASDGDCNIGGCSPAQIMYRWGIKWTERFIFQTRHQQQMAQEKWGKKGVVIRNIFTPPAGTLENSRKELDVLWIGDFHKNKYPEGFYEAAKALPQYRFGMIAKSVPEPYRELQKKIAALPNVRFFGMIPFQETQNYFARSKVYLCTSILEGFPNAFLQAWYSRVPVLSLTFPCDGILAEYDIGRVAGSPEKLQRDIVDLLEHPQLREEMGERGFRYVEANHLPDVIMKKYQEIIDLS